MTDKAQALIAHILKVVETGDHDGIDQVLAENVELNTPRFLKPITDKTHFKIVLKTIPKVIENFHYERTWSGGDEAIMEFKGNIGAIQVHGLDIFHLDADGKVKELTVFIRPTKAHAALAEAEDAHIMAQLGKAKA
jgi:ketosteroid isomerase-like protein